MKKVLSVTLMAVSLFAVGACKKTEVSNASDSAQTSSSSSQETSSSTSEITEFTPKAIYDAVLAKATDCVSYDIAYKSYWLDSEGTYTVGLLDSSARYYDNDVMIGTSAYKGYESIASIGADPGDSTIISQEDVTYQYFMKDSKFQSYKTLKHESTISGTTPFSQYLYDEYAEDDSHNMDFFKAAIGELGTEVGSVLKLKVSYPQGVADQASTTFSDFSYVVDTSVANQGTLTMGFILDDFQNSTQRWHFSATVNSKGEILTLKTIMETIDDTKDPISVSNYRETNYTNITSTALGNYDTAKLPNIDTDTDVTWKGNHYLSNKADLSALGSTLTADQAFSIMSNMSEYQIDAKTITTSTNYTGATSDNFYYSDTGVGKIYDNKVFTFEDDLTYSPKTYDDYDNVVYGDHQNIKTTTTTALVGYYLTSNTTTKNITANTSTSSSSAIRMWLNENNVPKQQVSIFDSLGYSPAASYKNSWALATSSQASSYIVSSSVENGKITIEAKEYLSTSNYDNRYIAVLDVATSRLEKITYNYQVTQDSTARAYTAITDLSYTSNGNAA